METRTAYCPACDRAIEVGVTTTPVHGGQANLDDEPSLVCLDFGSSCTSTTCPVFGLPRVVMGVQLARSEFADQLPTYPGRCDACGQLTELRAIDRQTAVCSACGAVNRLVALRMDDATSIVVTSLHGAHPGTRRPAD